MTTKTLWFAIWQLDVVLDMAHKVEDGAQKCIPSRDRLLETVIFHIRDVMMISAINVDLDYACKG